MVDGGEWVRRVKICVSCSAVLLEICKVLRIVFDTLANTFLIRYFLP